MRRIRPIHYRLAVGIILFLYLNALALVQIFLGYSLIDESNAFFLLICGSPIVFYFAGRLNKEYNKEKNDDIICYYFLGFLIFSFVALCIIKR
jgi:hypothetical protein